ncbi:hypothetical protein SmJEL517_g03961 [Synchytrium microbalum]|uniref:PX domain-containing protein n=1 Tax=Synchytrium microbalum TaxID=1806994 RepID=A0A507BVW2_9FUNG|nr:uncharacterized protein SmJEL517_g03961 [Synchytrium microbalum]TPX32997.1 hypothetical protein SmJEL517_g03961 [Synchytrium microbalum]
MNYHDSGVHGFNDDDAEYRDHAPTSPRNQSSFANQPRPLSEYSGATATGTFSKSNTSSSSSLHRSRSLESTTQVLPSNAIPVPVKDAVGDGAKEPCCNIDRALRAMPFSAFCPNITTGATTNTNGDGRSSLSGSRPSTSQQNWSAASLNAAAKRPPIIRASGIPPTAPPVIQIADAKKVSEFGSSYISYVIQTDLTEPYVFNLETQHRYSDFEGLRKLLQKVYPTIVVPPIPEKHSVAAYATKPGKAKEDPSIIEKRKRLLQSFLNRVAAHPILGKEHVFHQFLQPNVTWIDNLASSGMAHHLRKKDSTGSLIGERASLRQPDAGYAASEDFTSRFAAHISHTLKVHKRIVKHYQEMSSTYSELGSVYNGWSLSETQLSEAIEKVGQAVDSTVSATTALAGTLEERFSEPLGEYSQFSKTIEKVLLNRHRRHAAFEHLTDSLQSKHQNLVTLERSEQEAQRLTAAIGAEGGSSAASISNTSQHTNSSNNNNSNNNNNTSSSSGTTRTSSSGPRAPGLMAAINSIIDNDPELTRRNNISKTKDKIISLEDQLQSALTDLKDANVMVQKDLDLFQERKIADLRNMMLAYALSQREYHRRGVSAWEEAKSEVEKVSAS